MTRTYHVLDENDRGQLVETIERVQSGSVGIGSLMRRLRPMVNSAQAAAASQVYGVAIGDLQPATKTGTYPDWELDLADPGPVDRVVWEQAGTRIVPADSQILNVYNPYTNAAIKANAFVRLNKVGNVWLAEYVEITDYLEAMADFADTKYLGATAGKAKWRNFQCLADVVLDVACVDDQIAVTQSTQTVAICPTQ